MKNLMIEDIQSLKNKIGKIPSFKEYLKLGKYRSPAIRKIFGTWNTFIIKLCKNHHWEMDHNELSKEDKEKIILLGYILPNNK